MMLISPFGGPVDPEWVKSHPGRPKRSKVGEAPSFRSNVGGASGMLAFLRARVSAKDGSFAPVVVGLLLAGCVGSDFDGPGG